MNLKTVSLRTSKKRTNIPITLTNELKPVYGGDFEEDTMEIEYTVDPASGIKIDLANSTTSSPIESPGPIPIQIAMKKGTGAVASIFSVKIKTNLQSDPTRTRRTSIRIEVDQKQDKNV